MSTALLCCAILSLGQSSQGQFALRAQSEQPISYVYLPVTIHIALCNDGPTVTEPIGLERINVYTFVSVWHESAPKVLWKSTLVPETNPVPSRAERFAKGEEKTTSLHIGWQPDLPVLHKEGLWYVQVMWRGPGGEVLADPVEIRVLEPSGENGEVLDVIKQANALAALFPGFWEQNEQDVEKWFQLTERILKEHPSTTYALLLWKAARSIKSHRALEN